MEYPERKQPIIFGADGGARAYVEFASFEQCKGMDVYDDHQRKVYEGSSDLFDNPETSGDAWGPRLLDLAGSKEFGYLLDNSIADIQFITEDSSGDTHGYRLRCATGADIWSLSCADFNWISLEFPPVGPWIGELGGPWVSSYN